MAHTLRWTLQAHDEAEADNSNDLFGSGETPEAALRNLYARLETQAEQSADRAAAMARAVARIRGEIEAIAS